jgi:uncharacterized membrane protein
MSRKVLLIVVFLVVFVISVYLYMSNQLPPGVEPKGNETTIAVTSLITAIISLLGGVVTLITKIVELKGEQKKQQRVKNENSK